MINNLYCEECSKMNVCSWWQKLKQFTDYVKTPIPVELTIDACPEFVKENE